MSFSSSNSTTLNLTAGQVHTGVFEHVLKHSSVTIVTLIGSDEKCTLTLEFSSERDGTDKHTKVIDISSVYPQEHIHTITTDYLRVIVDADQSTDVNGTIKLIYHKHRRHPIVLNKHTITDNDDVTLTKSVMVGYNPETQSYTTINSSSLGVSSGLNVNLTSPYDAFGRLLVSNPVTLFTSKQQTQKDNNFDEKITGTASSSYTSPFPHNNLQVLASGDRVVSQSRMYVSYQPGKTLVYLMTGSLMTDDSIENSRARIGPFDDLNDKTVDTDPVGNGFFFQLVGDPTTPVLSLVYRTSMDDAVISPSITQLDTTVDQENWNIDKLDGTGVSGFTIDPTKRQIFFFMIAWLGVGDVVCGVFNNGKFVPCHRFDFLNGDFGGFGSVAYANTGSFPCRYELEATGTLASTVTMKKICCSVSSDSGFTPRGVIYSAGRSLVTADLSTSVFEPIFSIRLNESDTSLIRVRSTLNILKVKLLATTANDAIYRIYLFKSPASSILTSPDWQGGGEDTNIANSAAEYDVSATALTPSGIYEVVDEGYFSKNTNAIDSDTSDRFFTIHSNIAGVSDVLVVAAKAVSGNVKVLSSCQWQEYE